MGWIFGNYVRGRGAAGLLIVRLVFGLGIMLHGWQKIQSPGGPFAWMKAEAHIPAFFQGLATLAEFGGGLGIILGLLTPLAALGLICNMLVAIFMVHVSNGDPFVRRWRQIFRARRRLFGGGPPVALHGAGILVAGWTVGSGDFPPRNARSVKIRRLIDD